MTCNRAYSFILALCLSFSSAWAEEIRQSFKQDNYQDSMKAPSFLKFDMHSSKMGIISSSFTGVVKEFNIQGDFDKKSERVNAGKIQFNVSAMDTDTDARNHKMWEFCLNHSEFAEINVLLLSPIVLNDKQEQEIDASIDIRGKKKGLVLKLKSERWGDEFIIQGSTDASFSALEIPDPSIFIAKMQDAFKINFKVLLKRPAAASK